MHPTKHDLHDPIMVNEMENVLKQIWFGCAPGLDRIPSDVLKHGGQNIMVHLLHLHSVCRDQTQLPQDFKEALIVIYKTNPERSRWKLSRNLHSVKCRKRLHRYFWTERCYCQKVFSPNVNVASGLEAQHLTWYILWVNYKRRPLSNKNLCG